MDRFPLPTRAGVSPSYLWLPPGAWRDMLEFLSARFPRIPEEIWIARMAKGEVLDQDGNCLAPESPYRPGNRIFYYRERENETPIPFTETILYRDEHILVVDKPHFLPVIPSGRFVQQTLLARLKQHTGLEDLVPIHRLDRETAGIVLFSLNRQTRGRYQALFRDRQVEKVYEAWAPAMRNNALPLIYRSRLERGEPFFCMREVPGEPNAETHIEVLQEQGDYCLYRLRPVTGKTHQLRVHLAALGSPIVNDGFYPVALPCKGDDFSRPLQLLARSIAFQDPLSSRLHRFTSDFQLAGGIDKNQ